MPIVLINPMDETPRVKGRPAPRLDGLEGKTIALLDISKPGGNFFLDRLEELLTTRYGVKQVVRETKPTFTKPAPEETLARLQSESCQAVIEALAD